MSITLRPISRPDLQALADSRVPDGIAGKTADGALPPPLVAKRSLSQLDEGQGAPWCSGFYMVRDTDGVVVGGCGFKGAPSRGRIEIGYAVSPDCRNQGIATQAVRELLRLAFAAAEVSEVLAQILPTNAPSARVVGKLGFSEGEIKLSEIGEPLVQWVLRKPF
jgi:ribosomal-protein-alanine N-acetyltransferase